MWKAVCGKTLTLDARKSSDPDGNGLSCKWIFYKEPSTYKEELQLDTSEKGVCKIAIPENAAGKTIHIILELTDDGSPALTAYRRVIVSIK